VRLEKRCWVLECGTETGVREREREREMSCEERLRTEQRKEMHCLCGCSHNTKDTFLLKVNF
jgi:hypothetical protein